MKKCLFVGGNNRCHLHLLYTLRRIFTHSNKNTEVFGCYVILAFLLTKYNFHTASGRIRNKMCNFVS